MSFRVRFAPAAQDDLARLFDFLLEAATTVEDLEHAEQVIKALSATLEKQLALNPFSFRKAGNGRRATRRELIIPAGATGYVALYEIEGPDSVVVLAVRHQRDDDYH